jgi:L-asparaginase II
MTTTIIVRKDGRIIERTGTSGLTVTSIRLDNGLDVLVEFDDASPDASVAMIGTLLAVLDELHGENFVTQCFNHYAQDMDKQRTRVGKRDMVIIRGYKDRPLSKRRK